LSAAGPPSRPAFEAFLRALSQVVANPGLLLAPFALGAATLVIFAAGGAATFVLAGAAVRSEWETLRRHRSFPDFLEALREVLLGSPAVLLLILVGILVALLVVTAFAAWIRAGVTGALSDADARAGAKAPVPAYRLPSAGGAFFGWARRRFSAFFGLVNLYALVASFLAALFLVPLVAIFAGVLGGRTPLAGVGGLSLLIAVPVAIAGGAAIRIVYLVAGRVLVLEPALDAVAAVGRALAFVRASFGPSLTLYFIDIAGAMFVGAVFVVPRMLLSFGVGSLWPGFPALLAVTAVFMALQIAAGLAFDLVVTASFVALWPSPAAGEGAPEPLVR
jgi:hypothetical protein